MDLLIAMDTRVAPLMSVLKSIIYESGAAGSAAQATPARQTTAITFSVVPHNRQCTIVSGVSHHSTT